MPAEREPQPPEPARSEAFLAWLESVPDPEQRYSLATSALEQHQEMVSQLSALRAQAVADASQNQPVSSLARRLGVSRQRAYQLLREAGSGGRHTGDRDAGGSPPDEGNMKRRRGRGSKKE